MKKRLLSWLMVLTLCLTLLPATALAAEATPAAQTAGTHEHYLCGGTGCNQKGHEQEDGMTTFEPWPGIDHVITGHAYYLTENLNSFTVPDGVDLTLCLNGHNISSSYDGPTIEVKPGATFTLCNCKSGGYITHSNSARGAGVFVGQKDDSMTGTGKNSAVFHMYGGIIGGNSDGATKTKEYIYGSGVVVMGGTFYMYGGTITQNRVDDSYGGGVSVYNNGTFTMSGGTIRDNTAKYGGGVSVGIAVGINHGENKIGGTFTMSGGEITLNTGTYNAGGVYVGSGSDTHFTVSGAAQIKDNYQGMSYPNGTANNVYLPKGNEKYSVIDAIIKVGTLDSTAKIGVTTEEVGQTVATDVSAAAEKYFFSDNSKTYRLKYDSSESTLTMIAAAHSAHPICGDASCKDSSHAFPEGSSWQGVSNLSKITKAGYYYLTQNVEITSTWKPVNGVTLCLNGYSITMNSTGYAIWVNKDCTFTLCDCVGGGKITHTEGVDGRGVYVVGTFNMYGGSISGNRAQHGSGVCLDNGGKGTVFNMYGGEITGNTATSSGGGGVYVNAKSTFNMYGGSITDNLNTTSDDYGGGVYVSQDGTFTVSGKVNITGNKHKYGTVSNDSNVFLPFVDQSLKSFTIGEGGLAPESRIGVATNVAPNPGIYLTVATLSEGAAYTDGTIISDRTGDYVIKRSGNNINLYNGLPHEHYRCNGKNGDEDMCTGIGHTETEGVVTFTPWTETTSLPKTSGEYYLTKDVTLESTWSIQGTAENKVAIVLCLNGHSIQKNTSSSTDVIRINEHATLALCDCNGSGKNNGIITGGTNASGVNITDMGAFAMYGGSISGNGIGVNNGQRFYMYGGSITGNDRGVNVNSADFTVAGDVKITNNNTNGNVYLPSGKTITVVGALGENAKIGVTTASAIAEGGYATVAKGGSKYALTEDDLNAFASDSTYSKLLNGNNVVFTNGNLHTHAVCGKETCTDSHDTKSYMPLTYDAATMTLYCGGKAVESDDYRILAGTDENDNKKYIYYMEYRLPAGNYYLADNIALNGGTVGETTYVGGIIRTKGYNLNVNLCLNGKTLSATNPNTPLLSVPGTQTLTLSDCKGGGKLQTAADGYNVLQVFGDKGRGGTFTMYGGTISGARTGVYAFNYSVVNLFGGTITDNECGLDIGSNSSVTVGGTVNITGNTKQNLNLYTSSKTGAIISIDATLTQASRIGISSSLTEDGMSPIQIATGAENDALKYTEIFTADAKSDGYVVVKEGTELFLKKHQHSWTYALKSGTTDTITATCTAPGCPLTSGNGGSVTISAPAANTLTYDGQGKPATVTASADWQGPAANTIKVSYTYGSGNPPTQLEGDAVPTNARTYTAEIAVGTGDNKATASVTYTIGQQNLLVKAKGTMITYGDAPTHDGVEYTGFVNGENRETSDLIGTLTYTYNYEQYGDVGNGNFTITPGGLTSNNYRIIFESGSLGVAKKTVSITWSNVAERTYGDGKGEVTATVGGLVNGDEIGVTVEGNLLTVGQHTATATALTGDKAGNYQLPTEESNKSVTYTVGAAAQNLTFALTGDQTKTYGDGTFTNAATNDRKDGAAIQYSSDNTNVATVNANTGEVTIVGAGTAKITAKASATENYAEATAEYTLTVEPKELKATDLQFVESSNYFTKTYDGTAATGAVVVIKDSAKVNASDDLPTVTGTCVYNSSNVAEANTVTFTSAETSNTNYILPAGLTVGHKASITKRVLTVGKVDTISKTYNTLDNALDCVTGIELIETVSGETLRFYTSAETGGDYGIYETKFDNANAGQNKTITGTVALLESSALASNYTFKVDGKESSTAPFTATGEITPADGGSKGDVERTQKFTDGDPKTETIAWKQLLPAGQTWNYVSGYYSASSVTVDHRTDDNGALTYTITGGKENDVVVFTVSAKCNNYNDFTYTVKVTLTSRDSQTLEFKGIENGKVTKTYGDEPFTQTVTGAQTDVTYTSRDENVATVNAKTGDVIIVGAGTAEITATAEETDAYASASVSYTLTVNKATVTVKAKDKSAYVGDVVPELPTAPVKDTDYTVTGLIGEDTLSGTVTLAYGNTPDMSKVGEETITISGTLANANYEITYVNGKLSITNRPSSGGGSYTPTYPVSTPSKTENGSVSSNVKNASKGDTVTITVKPDSGYVLDDLTVTDKNGNELKLNDKGNGKYTFTMPAGKVEVKASFAEAVETSPFADVETNAYYYEAVKWAADKGITGGIGNSLFGPNQPCTRAQIVTFLWRAAGSPEPKGTAAGMTDVVSGSYYEKAVAWAIENGVTTGTTASTFSPNATCTRAQAVTFLARALSAKATSAAEFSDVPANSYFAEAVAWAAANSVTEGVGNGLFAPHNNCTRAQIVTFLYRAYNK